MNLSLARCDVPAGQKTRLIPAWGAAPAAKGSSDGGPKVRLIPAWGPAPGPGSSIFQGLKARSILSTPNMLFVPFDAITFEEPAELILKALLRVVGFLSVDVSDECAQIRRADREDAVASLPRKVMQQRGLRLEPLRRGRFQLFDELGDCERSRETDGKVYMIGNAADPITLASLVSRHSREVSMRRTANSIRQRGLPVFRAEDHVEQHVTQGVGHGEDYRSGFQPSKVWRDRTWGCAPGWYGTRLRRFRGSCEKIRGTLKVGK